MSEQDGVAKYLGLKKAEKDSTIVDVVADGIELRTYLDLGMIRRLAAERDRLRTENAQMTEMIKAAAKVIQPIWDAALSHIMPLWKQLEPLIDPGPHHGDLDMCRVCGAEIEFYEETAGTSDVVINSWWSHLVSPAVRHDAVPGGPS